MRCDASNGVAPRPNGPVRAPGRRARRSPERRTVQTPDGGLVMNATTMPGAPMTRRARKAADLMTPNPLSLRDDLTLKEAIAFLVDRSISGAAVIDEAGRPVGVLTQSDVLMHDREEVQHVEPLEVEHGS